MSLFSPVLSGHTYPHKHVEHAFLPGRKFFPGVIRVALEFVERSKKHLLRNASGVALSQSIEIIPEQSDMSVSQVELPVRSQAENEYLLEMGQWHHRRQRRSRRLQR